MTSSEDKRRDKIMTSSDDKNHDFLELSKRDKNLRSQEDTNLTKVEVFQRRET